MKRLHFLLWLLLLAALLVPQPAQAANAIVSGNCQGSTNGNGFTTTAISTTGANTIVLMTSSFGTTTPTDSASNTWTGLTSRTVGGAVGRLWYAKNITTSASHTFTLSGSSNSPSVCSLAISGADTTAPFDQELGATGTSVTTLQPGSITPTTNNQIVVFGSLWDVAGGTGTVSGYTVQGQVDYAVPNHYGAGIAYVIQTTATATNPTWTYNATIFDAAVMTGSFKAAATSPRTLTLTGVGN